MRAALLLFWLVPAFMGTIGFRLVPSRLNPTLSTGAILLSQLGMWGGWALWTALTWMVGDRVPYRAGHRVRFAVVHLLLGMAIIGMQIFLQAAVSTAFGLSERRGFESTLVLGIRSYGDVYVVVYVAIVVSQLATRLYSQWQAERVAAARMSEDLAQAHLRALQAQLNPHFLFNALNSIVTLIGRDPALAQQLVVRLADLLRTTLRTDQAQEVTLAQELEFTRRYLDIEQVRFADRLTVSWPASVPAARLPAFALQPLVENALLHGIARQSGPGMLSIRAAQEGDMLVLRVRDSGPGLAPRASSPAAAASMGAGTGLSNLRARITRRYGERASLVLHDLHDLHGAGVEAELRVPFVPDDATTPMYSGGTGYPSPVPSLR
jgi:sensor histidine kinase YesM